MTNGEVLIKMFPKTQVRDIEGSDFFDFTLDGIVGHSIEKRWWNVEWDGDISDIQPKIEQWIPITSRPMTEDEKPWHEDCYDGAEILDCPLPDDGQEVLITVYGGVEVDTFIRDEVDGCYFENRDIGDVKAWMPLPPAWKGEKDG